jgi:AICAR transformylase/IMP cyclohydrolase PurH
MLPVLAEMIPQRQTDELLARRLVDCETKIAEYEQEIRRLVRLAAKAEDEMADAYDAEARTVQRELKRLRTENDRLQQQATSHTARYEEQIASILAKLTDASAPNALYETRARLNQLLGRHISVRLGEDRVMRININAHSGLAPVIALISLNGLEAIDVIDRDGSVLTRYEAGVLALLEPVNACRDEAGGHELDPCSISAPVSGLARYGAC